MSSFATEIAAWHDFFILTGTAAVTLTGLLFVAVSLRDDIRRQAEDAYVRTVVEHNMLSYITVLLFSLYFIVPEVSPSGIATPLIITAAVALVAMVRDAIRLRHDQELTGQSFWWGFLVPSLCYLATIMIGIALARGNVDAIGWFVAVIAFLITVPTINAWRLLMQSHEEG